MTENPLNFIHIEDGQEIEVTVECRFKLTVIDGKVLAALTGNIFLID